jgi:hypothetical protein
MRKNRTKKWPHWFGMSCLEYLVRDLCMTFHFQNALLSYDVSDLRLFGVGVPSQYEPPPPVPTQTKVVTHEKPPAPKGPAKSDCPAATGMAI